MAWPWFVAGLNRVLARRARSLADAYWHHLLAGPTLDVGSGTGHTVELLRRRGLDVVALDVVDQSIAPGSNPVIYDGTSMPFREGAFGTSIIQTVLHHTPHPESVLAESARVSRRLVVVEDVVRGPLNRLMTKWIDSILNLEFRGHPHTNKTHEQWTDVFASLGLVMVGHTSRWTVFGIWQVTYVVDVRGESSL